MLADSLGLSLVDRASPNYDFMLVVTDNRLELQQTGKNAPGPVFTDFSSKSMLYRLKQGGGIHQHLAKAVGIKSGHRPLVLDATAGLGRDGFVLAHLGCQVTMVERSPVLAALLEDGLIRAGENPELEDTVQRIKLVCLDSIEYMETLSDDEKPETVYLDPMFPERTKSALVKKEMRILREIAGADENDAALLEAALKTAAKRIAVKRPRLSPFLADEKPSFSLKDKSSRFDVYLV